MELFIMPNLIGHLLFEKSWHEHGEVDSPVFPDVAVVVFEVFVSVAFFVEVLAELYIFFIKEVILADSDPVQCRILGELYCNLLHFVLINGTL